MKPIKGIFFRDFYNDYIPDVIKETWMEKLYEPYRKDGSIVIEVGANVGIFTLYASEFAKKVYAVEPSEEHFETLTKMIEFNKLENVKPLKYAISNYDGKTTFYHSQNTTMYSLNQAVSTPDAGKEEVDVLTLKSLMEQEKITHVDLLNIDVEGEEMKIFSHSSFADVAPMIDTIVVEYHTWSGVNPAQLINAIRDRGYKIKQLQTKAVVLAAERI